MKNRKRIALLITVAVISVMMLALSACSASIKSNDELGPHSASKTMVAVMESEYVDETADLITDDTAAEVEQRKIIENISLHVQTKTFDALIEGLNKQIKELGGYIESSDIAGQEIGSNDERWARLKVRVPSDKSASFSDYMAKNSTVVNRSVTTEDITLTYVDMESRVKALELEKESLEKLLQNATSVSDIITVRDKLTQVIHKIESYKSQLRAYDNLVSYSTVEIEISEVERLVVVEKQTTWQKIGTNLKNNFAGLGKGLTAIFVFLVSAIPYLLIPAAIAVLIVVLCKRKAKKKRERKEQSQETEQ